MTPEALLQAMEATWPPAHRQMLGPVVLRQGRGGGKRVSAASVLGSWTPADLDLAEAAARQMGQSPLFQVLPAQATLDKALAARGYALIDPVLGYAAPVETLARPIPPLAAFAHWPPMQIARDIWAEAGIGDGRLAVMERVQHPKAVILARAADRPAGVAFVAAAGPHAMLHALNIRPDFRRKGAAAHLVRAAALWAGEQGASHLGLVVTRANAPARALYEKLCMDPVAGYHYRELPR